MVYGLDQQLERISSKAFTENIQTGEEGFYDSRYPHQGRFLESSIYVSLKLKLMHNSELNAGARLGYSLLKAQYLPGDHRNFVNINTTNVVHSFSLSAIKRYKKGAL